MGSEMCIRDRFCTASGRKILAISAGIRIALGRCTLLSLGPDQGGQTLDDLGPDQGGHNHSLSCLPGDTLIVHAYRNHCELVLQGTTTPTTISRQVIIQGLIKLPGATTLAFVPSTLSVAAAAVKQSDLPRLASRKLSSFEQTSPQRDSATFKP